MSFFEDNLINLMPRKFRSVEAWRDFMLATGQLLDDVHAKLDGLADLQDPDEVPVAYMQYLANLLGLALHDSAGTVDLARKRILLKSAVEIFKSKGLASLMEDLAHFLYFTQFAGSTMDVHELWTDDYVTFRVDDWKSTYVPVGWVGNGVATTFATVVTQPPVRERSVQIASIAVGGGVLSVWDDDHGELQGDLTAGTINYTTGAISVTFDVPPANGENITLIYVYEGSQYLSPHFLFAFPIDIYWNLGQTPVTLTPSGWIGNGVVTNFTTTLASVRVKPGTLQITAVDIFGYTMTVTDDGLGNLTGDVGSGVNTIDYDTGALDVTFDAAVELGASIVVTYMYQNLYLGRQRMDSLLAYLERYRPAHTVRRIEIGQQADFWRVGVTRWRVGETGFVSPPTGEIIRVGGSIWS